MIVYIEQEIQIAPRPDLNELTRTLSVRCSLSVARTEARRVGCLPGPARPGATGTRTESPLASLRQVAPPFGPLAAPVPRCRRVESHGSHQGVPDRGRRARAKAEAHGAHCGSGTPIGSGRGHPGPRPRPRPRFVRGRGRGVRPRFARGRGRSPVPVPDLSGIGDPPPSPSPIC